MTRIALISSITFRSPERRNALTTRIVRALRNIEESTQDHSTFGVFPHNSNIANTLKETLKISHNLAVYLVELLGNSSKRTLPELREIITTQEKSLLKRVIRRRRASLY